MARRMATRRKESDGREQKEEAGKRGGLRTPRFPWILLAFTYVIHLGVFPPIKTFSVFSFTPLDPS